MKIKFLAIVLATQVFGMPAFAEGVIYELAPQTVFIKAMEFRGLCTEKNDQEIFQLKKIVTANALDQCKFEGRIGCRVLGVITHDAKYAFGVKRCLVTAKVLGKVSRSN